MDNWYGAQRLTMEYSQEATSILLNEITWQPFENESLNLFVLPSQVLQCDITQQDFMSVLICKLHCILKR